MSIGSHAAEVPLAGNAIGRNYMSLNGGGWNYIVEYDFDTSPVMKVPGGCNTQDGRLFFYEGCVWFKKDFEYRKKEGQRTVLYFGAVNYEAIVYVNEKKVGSHVG